MLFCKELEGCLEDIEKSDYRESNYFNENYNWFSKNRKKSVLGRLKSTSSVIAKYEIIAILLYGEPLCRDEETIIKDTEYLIKIRNALVHFSPEVEAELMGRSFELKRHAEIKDSKENRFSYSPFFGEEYVSFRNSMIHAVSAEWAYNTAKDFIVFYNETIMSKWTK
ncbi:MAG: hypothetical protein ACTFAL_06460 [Candidatus Electronema sp. V4]|uniref:hypothetical protein n=1 Tax=Candidatus Electronema sp. V4 TaxID=3454756 RepID=UPI00405552DE